VSLPPAPCPENPPERRVVVPRWMAYFRPEDPAQILRSLIRVVVFIISAFVLWWLVAGVMAHFVDLLITSAVSLGVTAFITTVVMMRIYEMRPFYLVGLIPNRQGAVHLGAGVVFGAGSSFLVVATQWAFGWAEFQRTTLEPLWGATIASGFLILLVGATGEELLFRGYAFQHLICAFGPWFSITLTSALFAWAHTANPASSPVGMVNTALFGAVFGYAYWRTRDLWFPLGMHFAWNFTLASVGAKVSGLKIKLMGISVTPTGPVVWSGGEYGPEGSLLSTMALAGTVLFLWKAPLGRQELALVSGRKGGLE